MFRDLGTKFERIASFAIAKALSNFFLDSVYVRMVKVKPEKDIADVDGGLRRRGVLQVSDGSVVPSFKV